MSPATVLLTLIAILLAMVTASAARPAKQDVDHESMLIAADLYGIRTDQGWQIGAPGYPMIVAAVARADPRVGAAVACHANGVPCAAEASLATLVALQYTMAVVTLIVALFLAYRLSGGWEPAILTLLLTFLGSRLGAYAGSASALISIASGTYLYLAVSFEAYRRRSAGLAFAAGVGAAAVALLYPFAAIVPAVLGVTLFFALRETSFARRLAVAVALLVGAASVALAFHVYGPAAYDPHAAGRLVVLQLSERLGYQAMDVHDSLGSLILPLPFVGGWLEFLFSDDTARRLAHGYAALSREEIFPRAVAQRRRRSRSMPGSRALTSSRGLEVTWPPRRASSIAVSGAGRTSSRWSASFTSSACSPTARRTDVAVLWRWCLAPIFALLVVNTLLSANPAWANAAMPFVWAYTIAYVVARFPSSDRRTCHGPALSRTGPLPSDCRAQNIATAGRRCA